MRVNSHHINRYLTPQATKYHKIWNFMNRSCSSINNALRCLYKNHVQPHSMHSDWNFRPTMIIKLGSWSNTKLRIAYINNLIPWLYIIPTTGPEPPNSMMPREKKGQTFHPLASGSKQCIHIFFSPEFYSFRRAFYHFA